MEKKYWGAILEFADDLSLKEVLMLGHDLQHLVIYFMITKIFMNDLKAIFLKSHKQFMQIIIAF